MTTTTLCVIAGDLDLLDIKNGIKLRDGNPSPSPLFATGGHRHEMFATAAIAKWSKNAKLVKCCNNTTTNI